MLFGLVVAIVLTETLCTAYAYWKYDTFSIEQLHELETANTFISDFEKSRGLPFVATLQPHPYLAFVRNEKAADGWLGSALSVNNVGLFGRDFPLEKDADKFTILLTGGSVATQLNIAGDGPQSYLEKFLNEDYDFGKEVVVLGGSNGAWSQPLQAIMFVLYGDIADAVVTLDGFNDFRRCTHPPYRLEYPGLNFHRVNPIAKNGFARLATIWQANELKTFSKNHNLRTIFFATKFLRERIESSAAMNEAADEQAISIEQIYSLPQDWSRDKMVQFNVDQYKKYIRLISSMADCLDTKQAFFVQPCPAINKPLTAEEQRSVGKLGYRGAYLRVTDDLLALGEEQDIPVISLLDVFAETDTTVYSDRIHCAWNDMNQQKDDQANNEVSHRSSDGYRILAKEMSKQLAKEWKIPARK